MTNMCVSGATSDHSSITEIGKAAGIKLVPLLREILPEILKT
jgi:hypothetical protein